MVELLRESPESYIYKIGEGGRGMTVGRRV
jgi:hypothetical protein